MSNFSIDRRRFMRTSAALGLAVTAFAGCEPPEPKEYASLPPIPDVPAEPLPERRPYTGPNVILIRFGGGVRRRECIRHDVQTYCPFIFYELAGKQGILFNNVEIANAQGVNTSHGEGTLYLLTGRYDKYEDVHHGFLKARFEPKVPTLPEQIRRYYDIPAYQALIVNGEDRIDEEFYTFSNHRNFGIEYRSTVLSLYQFKTFLAREEAARPDLDAQAKRAAQEKLRQFEDRDFRQAGRDLREPKLDEFWGKWRDHYGKSGLVNPRGDRLLTELSLWALRDLRPKFLMINYQDPDYVHWGPASFYTQAISVIDEGVMRLHAAVQADPEYRDNTVFVIVPDCGRDDNVFQAVPFQHHFNSRSSHEVFVIAAGKGVRHESIAVDRKAQQIQVTSTIGRLMGIPTPYSSAEPLAEVFA